MQAEFIAMCVIQKASRFLCPGTKNKTDVDGTEQNERIS